MWFWCRRHRQDRSCSDDGNDPLKLIIRNTSPPKEASALPYQGRYPCGHCRERRLVLRHLLPWSRRKSRAQWVCLELAQSRPIPGFQISVITAELGAVSLTPAKPLFPEPSRFLGPVKMGAPHLWTSAKTWNTHPMARHICSAGRRRERPQAPPCINRANPARCSRPWSAAPTTSHTRT